MTIAVLAPEIHEPFIEGIQKSSWAAVSAAGGMGHRFLIFTQRSYGGGIPTLPYASVYPWLSSFSVRPIKYLLWLSNAIRIVREIRARDVRGIVVFSLDWSFILPLMLVRLLCPRIPVRIAIFSMRDAGLFQRIFFAACGGNGVSYLVRSSFMRDRLIVCGIPPNRIEIFLSHLEGGVIPPPFSAIDSSLSRTVLYLSSADSGAGADAVLRAARAVPDCRFVLAVRDFGARGADAFSRLERRVMRENLPNVFLERNIDVPAALFSAGAVVLPPRSEQDTMDMPLVLLESFYARVPAVVSDNPVFSDMIRNGYVLPYRDAAELSDAIRAALDRGDSVIAMLDRAGRFADALPDASGAAREYFFFGPI